MSYWAYLFEARTIQEYILDGRDFAEQIAAGQRVESVCGEPLSAVLDTLGLNPDVGFSRRTAGAFHAVLTGPRAGEQARRLRDLWGIAASCYCPGLDFVHALAEGGTPLEAVRKGIRELAKAGVLLSPAFPEAPPIARRDPRTGRAAVAEVEWPGGRREWLDAVALRKRSGGVEQGAAARALDFAGAAEDASLAGLAWPDRLLAGEAGEASFPWLPGNHYLAAIRVAVNDPIRAGWNPGCAVGALPLDYPAWCKAYSEAVETALRRAAQRASAAVLAPATTPNAEGVAVLPARPVLLRDGEFTALVRADLALAFVAAFLGEFERESGLALAPLIPERSFPPSLTGSAGIAFALAGWPLAMADRCAGSLCSRAGCESGKYRDGAVTRPSSMAFGLLGGSPAGIGGVGGSPSGAPAMTAGWPAYGIAAGPLPSWRPLEDLAALFAEEDLAIGPTRQLVALLCLAPADASKQYRRWREALGKSLPRRLESLDALLAALGVRDLELPGVRRGGAVVSPLADALVLRAVGHASPGSRPGPERCHA